MEYNFTDDARRALAMSRNEAHLLGHDYVGTEHMLLGLVRHPECAAAALLAHLGVEAERVQAHIDGLVRKGRSTAARGELPYTSRAKRALEFALAEARRGIEERDSSMLAKLRRRAPREQTTRSEHLLIGLLLEEKGIAAQVLTSLGVTIERARATMDGGSVSPAPRAGESAQEDHFHIRLDDASDRSIYEQIIARVQEAVAMGELAPGARLPAVRQLADRLDIAPGTVARAYSELERLGVVVTQGARGTRVADASSPSAKPVDIDYIAGLLRPSVVAAFHTGARAEDVRRALTEAMRGIFDD